MATDLNVRGVEAREPMTPTEVVTQAFDALRRRDWPAFLAMVHPDDVGEKRQDALGMLILVAERRRAGQETGGGFNPQDVDITAHLGSVGATSAHYFHATIAELAALSSSEFFLRWCDAAYRTPPATSINDVPSLARRIVGELVQGNRAEVVYRRELRSQEGDDLYITLPGSVELRVLEQVNGQWRLHLNHELADVDITGMFAEFDLMSTRPLRRHVTTRNDSGPPMHLASIPDPSKVLRDAFDGLSRHDWPSLATLVDSERLMDFQEDEIASMVAELSPHSGNRMDFGGIVVVQTSRDSTPRIRHETDSIVVRVFAGSPTVGALRQLSPGEFFVKWCEAVYGTGLFASGAGIKREIVGHVFEGADRAQVVYSHAHESQSLPYFWTMPFRYSARGWRMLLNEDLGSASQLGLILLESQH